jgi:hypothetical protein
MRVICKTWGDQNRADGIVSDGGGSMEAGN